MDLESVAAELYELVPPQFTAARDAYVASARKAGDKPLATAIGALRKPTVAAWAAGLLARRRPKQAHALVQLGEALRTAHRTLVSNVPLPTTDTSVSSRRSATLREGSAPSRL